MLNKIILTIFLNCLSSMKAILLIVAFLNIYMRVVMESNKKAKITQITTNQKNSNMVKINYISHRTNMIKTSMKVKKH